MAKKLLNELTNEELKELYKVNNFLQEQASETAADNVQFWLDDILHYFRGTKAEYNIGYPGNYFHFNDTWAGYNDYKSFFEALETVKNTFCVFSEKTAAKIERAGKKIDFYLESIFGYEDISEENSERITKYIDGLFKTASDEILQFLVSDYESQFDEELIIDEFLPLFVENCGDQYETDGEFIYETECRKYA